MYRTMRSQSLALPMLALVLAMAGGAPSESVRQPGDRPNFVLVFIDDMGYGDVGAFGSTANRTPELDALAAGGMKLTSFYAHPVCTPSRAALLTGCYPVRNGLQTGFWHPVLMPGDPQGIHPDEVTVAEALKQRGYATGMVGKWHLGDQPEFLPNNHGFDYHFGLPYSNDMSPFMPLNPRNHPPLPLLRNGELEREVPEDQSFLTGAYTEEALAFIERHRDEPFFLYVPHSMVHVPLWAGEAHQGSSANGILGDCIEELDWSMGEIRRKLEEFGLAENTLIFFTSDNGPARGSAGPLRGRKGSTYEGGVRVPAIAYWPGSIPSGSVYADTVSTMDILPTFAALAGAPTPAERAWTATTSQASSGAARIGRRRTTRSSSTGATNCGPCGAANGSCTRAENSTTWNPTSARAAMPRSALRRPPPSWARCSSAAAKPSATARSGPAIRASACLLPRGPSAGSNGNRDC